MKKKTIETIRNLLDSRLAEKRCELLNLIERRAEPLIAVKMREYQEFNDIVDDFYEWRNTQTGENE